MFDKSFRRRQQIRFSRIFGGFERNVKIRKMFHIIGTFFSANFNRKKLISRTKKRPKIKFQTVSGHFRHFSANLRQILTILRQFFVIFRRFRSFLDSFWSFFDSFFCQNQTIFERFFGKKTKNLIFDDLRFKTAKFVSRLPTNLPVKQNSQLFGFFDTGRFRP